MLNPIDFAVINWFAGLTTPAWLDAFMIFWTNDIQRLYVVAAVGMLFFKQTRKAGIAGVIAIILSVLSVNICWKHLFERVRPYNEFDFVRLIVDPETSFSFPSAHTSMAFAAVVAMCYRRPPLAKASLIFCAAFTAFSRLYVGVHYLTDVCAGAVNGIICALLAIFIISIIEKRRHHRA